MARPLELILRGALLFVLVAGSSSGSPELDYQLAVLNKVDGVTGAMKAAESASRQARRRKRSIAF